MKTIELEIQDSVMDKFMDFVNSFKNSEIKVKNTHFENAKAEVQNIVSEINSGKMTWYTLEEVENKLEETILKYEDKIHQ